MAPPRQLKMIPGKTNPAEVETMPVISRLGWNHPPNQPVVLTPLFDHEDFHTKAEAKQSQFDYIEIFYNRRRRHSYLGYISPGEIHFPQ